MISLAPPVFFEVLIFVFGALLGSFSNVIIYRYPRGESVVKPRSHCYSCKKMVPFYFNIPILSWFILRGKCYSCKAPFSFRYPVVEIVMGVLYWMAYKYIGPSYFLLEALIFIFALVTACVIDIDHYILPNLFTKSGIFLGLLGGLLNPERDFKESCFGFLVGYGLFRFAAFAYKAIRKRDGLGGGDVKLLGWIGALLGPMVIPWVVILSCFVGTFAGLILMLTSGNGQGMQQKIAFGPYIGFAGLVFLFFGTDLIAKLFPHLFYF